MVEPAKNIFDQFDQPSQTGNVFDQIEAQSSSGNVFDQFDNQPNLQLVAGKDYVPEKTGDKGVLSRLQSFQVPMGTPAPIGKVIKEIGKNIQSPFSNFAKATSLPTPIRKVAEFLDLPFRGMTGGGIAAGENIGSAIQNVKQGNYGTAALETVLGAGEAGMGMLNVLPSAAVTMQGFNVGNKALEEASPTTAKVIGEALSPFSKRIQIQEERGDKIQPWMKPAAGIADVVYQFTLFHYINKGVGAVKAKVQAERLAGKVAQKQTLSNDERKIVDEAIPKEHDAIQARLDEIQKQFESRPETQPSQPIPEIVSAPEQPKVPIIEGQKPVESVLYDAQGNPIPTQASVRAQEAQAPLRASERALFPPEKPIEPIQDIQNFTSTPELANLPPLEAKQIQPEASKEVKVPSELQDKVKHQGDSRDKQGNVSASEYIITDKNSPAYNGNFTVLPGQSITEKYNAIEKRFAKPTQEPLPKFDNTTPAEEYGAKNQDRIPDLEARRQGYLKLSQEFEKNGDLDNAYKFSQKASLDNEAISAAKNPERKTTLQREMEGIEQRKAEREAVQSPLEQGAGQGKEPTMPPTNKKWNEYELNVAKHVYKEFSAKSPEVKFEIGLLNDQAQRDINHGRFNQEKYIADITNTLKKDYPDSQDAGKENQATPEQKGYTLEGEQNGVRYYRTPDGKEVNRVGADGVMRFESTSAGWDSSAKKKVIQSPKTDELPGVLDRLQRNADDIDNVTKYKDKAFYNPRELEELNSTKEHLLDEYYRVTGTYRDDPLAYERNKQSPSSPLPSVKSQAKEQPEVVRVKGSKTPSSVQLDTGYKKIKIGEVERHVDYDKNYRKIDFKNDVESGLANEIGLTDSEKNGIASTTDELKSLFQKYYDAGVFKDSPNHNALLDKYPEIKSEFYKGRFPTANSRKYYVEQKIKSGESVPPEVLKDYPDLQPKVTEEPIQGKEKFIGSYEVGDTYKTGEAHSVVLGNFDKKYQAEQLAQKLKSVRADFTPKVTGYLNGKYKRGWTVIQHGASEEVAKQLSDISKLRSQTPSVQEKGTTVKSEQPSPLTPSKVEERKPLWQTPFGDYLQQRVDIAKEEGRFKSAVSGRQLNLDAKDIHERAIEQAIAEGKSVPREVLTDYPELQKQVESKLEEGRTQKEQNQSLIDQLQKAKDIRESVVRETNKDATPEYIKQIYDMGDFDARTIEKLREAGFEIEGNKYIIRTPEGGEYTQATGTENTRLAGSSILNKKDMGLPRITKTSNKYAESVATAIRDVGETKKEIARIESLKQPKIQKSEVEGADWYRQYDDVFKEYYKTVPVKQSEIPNTHRFNKEGQGFVVQKYVDGEWKNSEDYFYPDGSFRAKKEPNYVDENSVPTSSNGLAQIRKAIRTQERTLPKLREELAKNREFVKKGGFGTNLLSIGGNIVANQVIQNSNLSDEEKKKYSALVNVATFAGLGIMIAKGATGQGIRELVKKAKDEWIVKGTRSSFFKDWFGDFEKKPEEASKVVDDNGMPLKVYSGHSNTPLYKNFDPKKATAGGFYASEDPAIASNYSLGKFGGKEYYENGGQYKLEGKNGEYNKKIWQIDLTDAQKAKIDELKSQKNEYGDNENYIAEMDHYIENNYQYDKDVRRWKMRGGDKNLQNIYEFYEQMGYNLASAKEGQEPYFMRQGKSGFEELLDNLGIKWQSYDWAQPGVLPVYLNIRNPLDADRPFPKNLLQALKDRSKYEREQSDQYGMLSSQWTKDYPLKQWVKDIESGDEGWTTQIPKKALPILEQFGYDGIKERGNKGSNQPREERGINWIAFEPEQIKSAIANKGTFDKTNPNMLLSVTALLTRPAGEAAMQLGGMSEEDKKKYRPLLSMISGLGLFGVGLAMSGTGKSLLASVESAAKRAGKPLSAMMKDFLKSSEAKELTPEDRVAFEKLAGEPKLDVVSKEVEKIAEKIEPIQKTEDNLKYAFNINKDRLNITLEDKAKLDAVVNRIKPELERAKGATLTNEEVIDAAQTSDLLRRAISREQTVKIDAAILKTRQAVAAGAQDKGTTREFIDNIRILSSHAANAGRTLQKFSINADPSLKNIKESVIKKLVDLGIETDKILEASKGVDFNNPKEVAKFYREFVKPTWKELISEYRYINLLSSVKTHITNAFSNLLQGGAIAPITKLYQGGIDYVGSNLKGRERDVYVRSVPVYYKGLVQALPQAVKSAFSVMKGETFTLRPDLEGIPTMGEGVETNNPISRIASKGLSKFNQAFRPIPNALEAADIFFQTLIQSGEREVISYSRTRQGKSLDMASINEEATNRAKEYLFRKELDPYNKTGQGHLLAWIDKGATVAYKFRNTPAIGWTVPFIRTPMNILKQGIEYSPMGLTTLIGSTHKQAQLAKAMVGSTVFAGAAAIVASNESTWEAPKSPNEKEKFYQSGKQPYSIKFGDTWVSYSKLGVTAYPIALAAAIKYHTVQSKQSQDANTLQKIESILGSQAKFFADQSYVQGVSDIIDAMSGGENYQIDKLFTNLPSQLIPLVSLQSWVGNLIDPVYRKPKGFVQGIAMKTPFTRGLVPISDESPKNDVFGMPREVANAFSPVQMSVDKTSVASYQPKKGRSSSRSIYDAVYDQQKNKDAYRSVY